MFYPSSETASQHKCQKLKSKFQCQFCPTQFRVLHKSVQHANEVHSSEIQEVRWIPCEFCQMLFPHYTSLSWHQKQIHPIEKDSFQIKGDLRPATFSRRTDDTTANHLYEVNIAYLNKETSQTTSNKLFQCPLCEKEFSSEEKLSHHSSEVHNLSYIKGSSPTPEGSKFQEPEIIGNKEFRCGVCNESFIAKSELSFHIQNHHPEEVATIRCNICQIKFSSERDLNGHLVKLHKPTYNTCYLCPSYFTRSEKYILHMYKDHFTAVEKEWFQCSDCGIYFLDKKHLSRHIMRCQNSGEKTNKCSFCPCTFTTNKRCSEHIKNIHSKMVSQESNEFSESKEHLQSHTPNDDTQKCETSSDSFSTKQSSQYYDCSICEERFLYQQTLNKHMAEEHNLRINSCQVCQREHNSYKDLRTHMQIMHRDIVEKEWFNCAICPRYFEKNSHLIAHQSTVHNLEGKKFKCDLCPRTFSCKPYLISHKQKQHPENGTSIDCTICQIQFSTQRDKINHSAKFHKATYKSCRLCPCSFATTEKYILHMYNAHCETVEKEWYHCAECEKYFPDKQYLLRHTAVAHKPGEKTNKCSFCPSTFTTKQRCSEHTKRVHSNRVSKEWSECSACKTYCPTEMGLRRHTILMHKMTTPKQRTGCEQDENLSNVHTESVQMMKEQTTTEVPAQQKENNNNKRYFK